MSQICLLHKWGYVKTGIECRQSNEAILLTEVIVSSDLNRSFFCNMLASQLYQVLLDIAQ